MKGFTLVEVLLTIFIFLVLASFFASVGLNFYKNQQLLDTAQQLLQTLRRAQSKAISGEFDSDFGVYLTNENFILFKGNSYDGRDPSYDEIFELPPTITVSGLSEIVFLKLTGIPKRTPAYCGGTCTPCVELNRQQCRKQDGCFWFGGRRFGFCLGNCVSCDNYQNQKDCEDQLGCIWYPSKQGGDIILTTNGQSQTININEIGRINLQ